jgi:hypothetical protein
VKLWGEIVMNSLRYTMSEKRKSIKKKYGAEICLYSSGEKFVYNNSIGKLKINMDPKIIDKIVPNK